MYQVEIQRLICDVDVRSFVCWAIDCTDEQDAIGCYLDAIPPVELRRRAHALHCKNCYKGEKKKHRAMRRFVRAVGKLGCGWCLEQAMKKFNETETD